MGSVPQSPRTAFRVLTDDVDRRVDRVVRRLLPRLPLSRLYQALREGDIRVNGARVAPATRTRASDLISVDRALAASGSAPRAARRHPVRAALPVLYRDAGTLVVNKPAGLAVHGGDDSVMARLAGNAPAHRAALSFAPAPVHQLDRITSGALVVALTLASARRWSAALRQGAVVKLYLALVAGDVHTPPDGAPWEDWLVYDPRTRRARNDAAGVPARARVWTLARDAAGAAGAVPAATLLLVRLYTGRRHQIRAQAARRGHALLGDTRYAPRSTRRGAARPRRAGPPLLHAAAIGCPALAPGGLIAAPLPEGARTAIERHFGAAAVQRATVAVTRRIGAPDGGATERRRG